MESKLSIKRFSRLIIKIMRGASGVITRDFQSAAFFCTLSFLGNAQTFVIIKS